MKIYLILILFIYGNLGFSSGIYSEGIIQSNQGFKFPDGTIATTASTSVATVITSCNCNENADYIQQAIDALPLSGGTVYLRAGSYLLTKKIHINKSNVTLLGEQGTLIKLGDTVNQPVLLIGTDKENPSYPNDLIQNIHVSHFEIDGNQLNQTSEFDATKNWIRNNGIDVRMVDHLWIEDMHIHDARSGGIVVSWHSHKIYIANVAFHTNYFDGIALYTSEDVLVSNFLSYNNSSAGISLDNDLKDVTFNGGHIKQNGKVGIFIRDAENIQFHNLLIDGNGEHGALLANDDTNPATTGVKQLFFQGCSFLNNNGYGLLLTGILPSDSANNTMIGNMFLNNITGCFQDTTGTLSQTANSCP